VARYYDNANQAQRFQPGTTVRADEVDAKFDQVASAFSDVESEVDRSLKFVADGSNFEISATATQRRGKVVGFNADGDMALLSGFGWRGDYASGIDYFVNDVFRDPATKNLYVVEVRHISTATIDQSKVALAIDVADIEAARQAAESARDLAKDWASKTNGTVDGVDFSAKHYATHPDVITLATDLQGTNTIGTVASDIADVSAVAGDLSGADTIGTVAADIANVSIVAADINDVGSVASAINSVISVAADLNETSSDIETVAASIDNVDTVAADTSEINAVAINLAPINTVADDLLSPNLSTDQIYDLGSVDDVDEGGDGSVDGYVITAVNNLGTYQTVANGLSDVESVAVIAADVTTVSSISTDVTDVAQSTSQIDTVSANLNPITAVAGITTAVSNVANIESEIISASDNRDDISTVADDIVFIRSAPAAASDAADARDLAQAYANNTEDIEVIAGEFSAKHYAAKAEADRTGAEQAKTDAESAESQAQTSRDQAAQSESNAAASESAAAQSESNAASSESNAAQSASLAATRLDTFDDAFLGAKSTDPSVDNDGDALATGALYFNATTGALRVYNGSAWIDAINASSALIAANNLADLDSSATSRSNLGLGDIATQNANAVAITGGTITDVVIDLGAVT